MIHRTTTRNLYTNLAQLLNSSTTATQSIKIITKTTNHNLQTTLSKIQKHLKHNTPLSLTIKTSPSLFNNNNITIINNFKTINLPNQNFTTITDHQNKSIILQQQLVHNLIYPTIIIIIHTFTTPITLLITKKKYTTTILTQLNTLFNMYTLIF